MTRSGNTITAYLLGGRPLYFPFISGTLRYACDRCDAPCCKGQGIGIGRSRELVTIQQAQPRAPLFSVAGFRGSALLSLQPPPEKCWFLDRKQRCRLEYVIGRDAKPGGCRLFPFHTVRALGESLVVLPDFLCPIEIGAPGRGQPSSHDELALEMHHTQVPRSGHPELAAPPDVYWDEALPLERAVTLEAEDFLSARSYADFAEAQHELTVTALGVTGRANAMHRLAEDVRRFLAIFEEPSRECIRDLVALTPTLRLLHPEMPRRTLPGVLVALSVLAGAYEAMPGSRRTARSLVAMWREQGPLLYALAHLSSRPMPRAGQEPIDRAVASLGLVRQPLLEVVRGIAGNGRRSVATTLEDLLRQQRDAFAPPLTADAVAMLHGLGRVMLEACTFSPV